VKAVILSAGQGKRLLPLTEKIPKCALDVAGRPIVIWQIDTLLAAGVDEVVLVLGHCASEVEKLLVHYGNKVRCVFNPFHGVSDNLASCWVAREEMRGDFLLLNGDTLFEEAIVRKLMNSKAPITVTVDKKPAYDGDDMKVHLADSQLLSIGKTLSAEESDAEAIGMIQFVGNGAAIFRQALDEAVRGADALKQWYLTIINRIARSERVMTCCIQGMAWSEVDTPRDLKDAGHAVVSKTKVAKTN